MSAWFTIQHLQHNSCAGPGIQARGGPTKSSGNWGNRSSTSTRKPTVSPGSIAGIFLRFNAPTTSNSPAFLCIHCASQVQTTPAEGIPRNLRGPADDLIQTIDAAGPVLAALNRLAQQAGGMILWADFALSFQEKARGRPMAFTSP